MNTKLKNRELFLLKNALQIVGRHQGVKLAYAMAKNLKAIEAEIELLQQTLKPSKEILEYEKKRIELCIKHAEVENGQPKMMNNNYVMTNRKAFDKEHEALKAPYQKKIEEQEKKVEEYNKFLDNKSNFEPYLISKDDLPNEITGAELTGIFSLIK